MICLTVHVLTTETAIYNACNNNYHVPFQHAKQKQIEQLNKLNN